MLNTTEQLVTELQARADVNGLRVRCLPDGNFNSQIAVIGEFPSDREVEMRRPLIAGSGAKLWEELRKVDVRRQEVYTTTACKRIITSGKDQRFPIDKNEQQHWANLLKWELSQLPNLKYILILGEISLLNLIGDRKINSWRGSVVNVDIGNKQVQGLVAIHPKRLFIEPKQLLSFKFDMSKFGKLVKGDWVVKPVSTIINPSFKEAMDYLSDLVIKPTVATYDIEVISNETACFGITDNVDEGMCISFRDRVQNTYSVEEEVKLRKHIQHITNHPNISLVAQNGMFDASWLWFKDKIRPKPHYFDTMTAHHTLYPTLPHNLGYLTTQYTTRPYYKDEGKDWKEGGDIDAFWKYNVQDVCNTHQAYLSMKDELGLQKLDKFFFEHVMKAQPHLLRMTVGGIKIDTGYNDALKDSIGADVQKRLQAFYDAVAEATGDPEYQPNPNSPKQNSELLFSKLRLVGRGTSTDATNRERMFSHPATTEKKRKVLTTLGEYAQEQKFFSTYVNASYDDDSRMRCVYNQTGVQSAPGRLSSSGMLWRNEDNDQTGCNLQNQPERAHDKFIADEGYCFGYFDLAQAEARAVAWEAGIQTWIDQFERARIDGSYDAHRALASDMFGIEYDNVPIYDRDENGAVTVRYVAKRCRHGLNYRMQADRLAQSAGLPLLDAVNAFNVYHKQTPELQIWWNDLEKEVRDNRCLYNAYGRRLIILEQLTPRAMESIVAFKPQSTVGDKVVKIIYQCENDTRWPSSARIMLNIHDALVCIAKKHHIQLCLSIMKGYAETPIYIRGEPMIIPADTKVSYENERGYHSWKTLKTIEVVAAKV